MSSEEIKYERVIQLLRKSKPVLRSPDFIEENVIQRIREKEMSNIRRSGFWDFLFGWVYIGWVRKGLVTVSFLLVFAFIYQQAVILKRVNTLNEQTIMIENQMINAPSLSPGPELFHDLAATKLPYRKITLSERQLKQLIKSFNEMEEKYSDLINLIKEDPELKEYVENRLSEAGRKKINL